MGANASKSSVESSSTPGGEEQAFYAERPVRFSPSLIQHLSDLPTPGGDNSPSTTRQTTLDEHIQARINSELARLKAEEAEIQERIARELEKENLDKESPSAKDEKIRSSTVLQQELADLSSKISVNREKRDVEKNFPEVHKARTDLLACYKAKQNRPLDCWYEAAEFRLAVKKAEQDFVNTEAVQVQ